MAISKQRLRRENNRLKLIRPGRGGPGKNSRRENRVPRKITIPWQGVGSFFISAGLVSLVGLFVLAVSFSLVYVYKYFTTNSYFSLKILEIEGNSRLSSKEILEITHLQDGANILKLSLPSVEELVARNPWVEEVSVQRVLPGKLVIGVREKAPVFWLLHNGSLHYADAWGKLIAPVVPGQLASLPALEVEPGAEEATVALPALVKSLEESNLPVKMASVSLVRLSAARGVEVYLEDSRLKLSIGLEEWLPNLDRLNRTLMDLGRRGELGQIREIKAQGTNVWVEKKPNAFI